MLIKLAHYTHLTSLPYHKMAMDTRAEEQA